MKYKIPLMEAAAEYAQRAEQYFLLMYKDKASFQERLCRGLNFNGKDPHHENRVALVEHGFFSLELFQAMICGGESYKMEPVPFLWDRLVDAQVMVKAFGTMQGKPFADYKIEQIRLITHLRDGTFLNLFAPPSALPDRYKEAIAAVDVTVDGKASRGTGFVAHIDGRPHFVTCRHNIRSQTSVQTPTLTTAGGTTLDVGDFVLSPHFDIAVAALRTSVIGPYFAFSDDVEVFDEVLTLGFPLVPNVKPLLLGHRGEVNGFADNYIQKCPVLIISNMVSPASSGGPVLSRDGHCVGMIINWLEGEWGDQKARFSAALPARILRQVMRPIRDEGYAP